MEETTTQETVGNSQAESDAEAVPEFEAPTYEELIQEPTEGEMAQAAKSAEGDLFAEMLPDTPVLVVPPPTPEAHRATITGVTREDASTGSVGIKISLTSMDSGLETDYTIWPPKAFVDDIKVDPTTLSDDPVPGKKQSPKERYGAIVRNSTKTAELQKLLALASEADRHASQVPNEFDTFVALLDELLSGLPVVFTRTVEKNSDPAFGNRLKVKTIESISTADNPKKFKKYEKKWESA
jgi:hypothetical protein